MRTAGSLGLVVGLVLSLSSLSLFYILPFSLLRMQQYKVSRVDKKTRSNLSCRIALDAEANSARGMQQERGAGGQ